MMKMALAKATGIFLGSGFHSTMKGHRLLVTLMKVRFRVDNPWVLLTIKNIPVALRIEWMKSRARAARWSEEVLLVVEEMCQVMQFLKWKAEWWPKADVA